MLGHFLGDEDWTIETGEMRPWKIGDLTIT
jgi:hypothetical protein